MQHPGRDDGRGPKSGCFVKFAKPLQKVFLNKYVQHLGAGMNRRQHCAKPRMTFGMAEEGTTWLCIRLVRTNLDAGLCTAQGQAMGRAVDAAGGCTCAQRTWCLGSAARTSYCSVCGALARLFPTQFCLTCRPELRLGPGQAHFRSNLTGQQFPRLLAAFSFLHRRAVWAATRCSWTSGDSPFRSNHWALTADDTWLLEVPARQV